MKICAAQTRPFKGDISRNIEQHKRLVDLAVSSNAEVIIFPELSITGYEPGLAKGVATDLNDSRLEVFQEISNDKNIMIGVGMPLNNIDGITISMIIFHPGQPRQVYSKQYLHSDEFPYFIGGNQQAFIGAGKNKMALSICYELSVLQHSANAHDNGAVIYVSSVAKSVSGMEKAFASLSGIAKQYAMIVIMANCTGHCDDFDCGGKTSAWNSEGILIGQLDDASEGVLIVDTDTGEVIERVLTLPA
jgi:predicted amidohydrolase